MNIFKSWTINFSVLLAVLGVVEQNAAVVKDLLGDNYGVVMFVVAILVAVLRVKTTKPLKEK